MRGLHRAGRLLTAGPFSDGAGGLAIVEVDGEGGPGEFLSHDPAVRDRVLAAELRPRRRIDWGGCDAPGDKLPPAGPVR